MAKVVVTGGAGFIASHIADRLIADDHDVRIIDDLSSGNEENLPKQASFERLDIRTAETAKFLRSFKPDIIIHAAAQISVRRSMEDPVFDAQVNVAGLLNILHAFNGQSLPHFVFLSTGGAIYGEQDIFPAPESHKVAPTSVYGLAKRVGEMYLDLWGREFGLRWTALRLANVYGPRQNPHGEAGVVAIFSEKLLAGEQPTIYGTGEQTRDFVFVGDVAAAAYSAVKNGVCGVYNIGTGVETSVNQLYRMIAGAAGSNFEPAYAPGRLGEQSRSSINADLARSALDWRPSKTIEEGLKITVDWFRTKKEKSR